MRRGAIVGIALSALACNGAKREQEVADSLAAVAAAETARKAAAVVSADSARRDSLAKAAATKTVTGGSKTNSGAAKTGGATTQATGTSTIVGRDSVRMGPIKRIPVAPDTGKKRPPP